MEYLDETEEKIIEDYLDRREADTERRRAQKASMSKDDLDLYLAKNAKWHRDRRANETEDEKVKRLKIRQNNYFRNYDKYMAHLER